MRENKTTEALMAEVEAALKAALRPRLPAKYMGKHGCNTGEVRGAYSLGWDGKLAYAVKTEADDELPRSLSHVVADGIKNPDIRAIFTIDTHDDSVVTALAELVALGASEADIDAAILRHGLTPERALTVTEVQGARLEYAQSGENGSTSYHVVLTNDKDPATGNPPFGDGKHPVYALGNAIRGALKQNLPEVFNRNEVAEPVHDDLTTEPIHRSAGDGAVRD